MALIANQMCAGSSPVAGFMVKILFLDDDASRYQTFRRNVIGLYGEISWVQTAEQAKELLTQQTFDIVFLDHDLNIDSRGNPNPIPGNTGIDVVNFIVQNVNPSQSVIFVHSLNGEKAREMYDILSKAGFECYLKPFCWKHVRTDEDRSIVVP